MTHESERVALAIYIREFNSAEDVKIDFDYNVNYFNEAQIAALAKHFEQLTDNVLLHPEKPLYQLGYCDEGELNEVITVFNDTASAIVEDKTLIDLMRETARNNASRNAVVDQHKAYSYADFEKRSNQIANFLKENLEITPDTPVAIILSRSADMLATMVGIMKAGAAYLPLDPSFPAERIAYILEQSKTPYVIAEERYLSYTTSLKNSKTISFEKLLADLDNYPDSETAPPRPDSLAYIIYTSGSTGNPKGVEIPHSALVNFLLSMQDVPGLKSKEKLIAVTTYSFDISILELFLPLITCYARHAEPLANAI